MRAPQPDKACEGKECGDGLGLEDESRGKGADQSGQGIEDSEVGDTAVKSNADSDDPQDAEHGIADAGQVDIGVEIPGGPPQEGGCGDGGKEYGDEVSVRPVGKNFFP